MELERMVGSSSYLRRYVTVHDKPTAYFDHPFKKNSTGYTNQNMTSTYDGRVRGDHFKSTYESFFNEELE